MQTGALEAIDSHPLSLIHRYTYGSAFKGTPFPGFGVFLKLLDDTVVSPARPAERHALSMTQTSKD